MKYKLQAFFASRNGMDDLAKVIFWPSFVVMLVSTFIGNGHVRSVLYYLSLAAMIYSYFRIFSKRSYKRTAENDRYVSWRDFQKRRFQERKTRKFYRCPKCHQRLRVPRGKGKIKITCSGCGGQLIKKT